MKLRHALCCTAVASLGLSGAASAASVLLQDGYGSMVVESGSMPTLFDGATAGDWTGTELIDLHQSLNGSGVTTDGMITILLADTADGLGFMMLFDEESTNPGGPSLTELELTTVAPSGAQYWINDILYDPYTVTDNGTTQEFNSPFAWNSIARGDAFAWTGLQEGDDVLFQLDNSTGPGLTTPDPIQILTWNGTAWDIAGRRGMGDGQEGGAFMSLSVLPSVVPLPAPLLLGLGGLAGVAAIRRRRSKTAA